MNEVWATVRMLGDFLDGVVRQADVGEAFPPAGEKLRTSGRVLGVVDETGARSRELFVDVRVAERRLDDGDRLHDCVVSVRVVGLCSMVVTASARDLHAALAEGAARAVRAVETRLAVALWPAMRRPA